jgi:hypothetical protein
VENPDWLQQTLRTPEDCSLCIGITDVDRVSKIAPELFERKYKFIKTNKIISVLILDDAPLVWKIASFRRKFVLALKQLHAGR